MDKEFTTVKVEILKLKLSFSELQVEKIQSIVNQEYETTFRINEIQFSIMSKLGQAKKFLEAELNSLELTVTNYPVIQEIHNLLLEFNYVNDEFKKSMEVKMRNYFSELKQLRKELQQNGDFSQAQKVYLEYVEIGKFIGEIPR